MDFFRKAGNWFKGAFGGNNDDEERRRREAEARRRAAAQSQKNTPSNFFGSKPQKTPDQTMQDVFKKTQTVEDPKKKIGVVEPTRAPRVNPQLKLKVQSYEQPGVQDVGGYYANDLKELKKEVSKGDQADQKRVEGIMKSLDNRKKELKQFHEERGKSKSFKTARALNDKVKATRGDWTKEKGKLDEFWKKVGADETEDMQAFLAERRGESRKPLIGKERNWKRDDDFSQDEQKVDMVKQEQENKKFAEDLLDKHADVPLSEFGNATVKQILDHYNAQDARTRRRELLALSKAIEKPKSEEQKNQAAAIYVLLNSEGEGKTSALDKLESFADTAADKVAGGRGREALRVADQVLPGVNTLGMEGFADEWDRRAAADRELLPDQSFAEAGAKAGSIIKGTTDAALLLLPMAATDKAVRASKFARGARNIPGVGKGTGLAARVAPGSVVASGIDYAQTVGRGDDPDLLKSGAIGLGADLLLGSVEGKLRPIRRLRQLFKGGDATEAATGGALTAAARRDLLESARKAGDDIPSRQIDELVSEGAEDLTTPSYQQGYGGKPTPQEEYKAAQRAARGENNPYFEMQERGLDPSNADEIPSFQKEAAAKRAAKAEEELLEINRQLGGLPDESYEAYKFRQKKRLADDIKANPANREALIQAYERRMGQVDRFQDFDSFKNVLRTRAEELQKLIDYNAQVQEMTANAVTKQGDDIGAAQGARQATNEEVAAAAAARTSPDPGKVVGDTPAPANPELEANDAYDLDRAYGELDANAGNISGRVEETTNPLYKMFNAIRRNTTDKYRSGVDKARDVANEMMYEKGIGSENALNGAPIRGMRTLFDKFGMKDIDRLKLNTYEAARTANADRVKAHANEIEDMFSKVEDPAETSKRLYQVFEEPDMLSRMYGEGTPKISPADLAPAERAIYDRLIELNKVRNEVWYRILQERHAAGLIDDNKLMQARQNYIKNKSGMHSPRIYDQDLEDLGVEIKGGLKGNTNTGAYKGRKEVAELSQDVIDSINANPAQSMLFRLQTGLDELGRIDTIKELRKAGYIRDTPPNKGWTKLEGAQYGAANGQYADNQIVSELERRQIFNSAAGQKTSDLLDVYRNSGFGTLDRAIKRAKTSYAPGTFLGNVISNPMFFNRGSGVNAVRQSYNMAKNVPALAKHLDGKTLDADILDMQRQGIKIGHTADELVGSKHNFRVIGNDGKMQSIKDIALLPNKVYAGADDLAKVSIYKELKGRGMDNKTAALRAAQFTQDYGNAGRVVQMLADSPVLGQPFARFVPELLRLTKNNVLYNPVGTFAGLYGLAALQKELSAQSGETDEEKAARQNAPGKVMIPFTAPINQMVGAEGDISLDFPVGDSAVNAARALGFNFPLEPGSDATTSLVKNLAPFAIPFMESPNGDTQFQEQQLVSSMFLRPLAEQITNKDFMGRSVDDPMNRTRWEKSGGDEKAYSDERDDSTKNKNRLYHLFMNYAPMSSEADALATKQGFRDKMTDPGVLDENKDYYGKQRTGLESLFRALGVKVESNTPEARQERLDKKLYFEKDLPATQAFLQENPDIADTYWKLKSTSKDRDTLVKTNEIITPERWQLIQSDKSGRLLNFLGDQEKRLHEQSIKDNREDPSLPIKPIDPLHQLNDEQKRVVVDIMSRPTGDDKETEQILRAEQPWFREFEDARRDYHQQNQKFYDSLDFEAKSKQNPRVEEYYNIPYPETPPLVQQYYDIMNEKGKDVAKEWGKAQGDALSEQFDADSAARLEYTNKKRKIEGYPPISEEVWNNKTYGYKEDDKGYGSGGGGRRARTYDTNMLGNLSDYTGSTKRYDPIEAKQMENIAQLFRKLQASGGGGRRKPPIGAAGRGQQ